MPFGDNRGRRLRRLWVQAEFSAPLLEIRTAGFQAPGEGRTIELALQARQLRLGLDRRPPLSRRRSITDALRATGGFGADTQLLQARAVVQRSVLACAESPNLFIVPLRCRRCNTILGLSIRSVYYCWHYISPTAAVQVAPFSRSAIRSHVHCVASWSYRSAEFDSARG